MRVTVLVENTSDGELVCEHGLSLLIEHNNLKILLDAGQSEAFYENAKFLNIDLSDIKIAVLSHGHYDHANGFEVFLENNKVAKIYAQKSATNKYYSANGGMHEIGLSENLLNSKERFNFTDGFAQLANDIFLVPHSTKGLEEIGDKAKLYKTKNRNTVPDDFTHEQSLVFATEKGLVIFNSCSHGGVANIIAEVKSACPNQKIYAYIGGLHMKSNLNGEEICTFTDENLDELCNLIDKEKVEFVYTGHCTGLVGLREMQDRLGDKVQALTTGKIFEL